MKNFLNKLLLVVMAFVLSLSVVGCKKNKDQGNESEKESKPVVEESVPDDTVPIVPSNGVDVSPVLGLLSPVLDSAYASLKVEGDVNMTADGQTITAEVEANLYIKNTTEGYDVIADFAVSYSEMGQSQSISGKLYYVGGTAVVGVAYPGAPMQYMKQTIGSFNLIVNQLNTMIAQDPEMKEQFEMIVPAIEEITAAIEAENIGKTAINETVNVKEIYDGIMAHIVANKETDMYSWLLANVAGVDPADAAAVTAFENGILALGAGDPTMAVVLDRVVAYLNAKLPADAQLNLEAIVDEIQAASGLTTAEIVDMVNEELFGYYVYDEETGEDIFVVDEEDCFPAPEAGVSAYDYFYNLLSAFKLNDLLASEGFESFEELCGFAKMMIQEYTFGDVLNMLADEAFGLGEWEYVYDPENGKYSYDAENDYYYYDSENGEYSEEYVPADIYAMLDELNIDLDNFTTTIKYTPDSKGRPTELSYSYGMDLSLTVDGQDHSVSQDVSLKLTLSYRKPSISFEIPADVLASAQPMGGGAIPQ